MELNKKYKVVKEFIYYYSDPFTIKVTDSYADYYKKNKIKYSKKYGTLSVRRGSIIYFEQGLDEDTILLVYQLPSGEFETISSLYKEEIEGIDQYIKLV